MAKLNVPATARASFYIYNTREEVDALAEAIAEAARFFGNGSA
jgi:cysteine desulfurase/selenocysteine lyase